MDRIAAIEQEQGESYYYEKSVLDGEGEKLMTQLQDGTIATVDQKTGSTVWIYAPDGSKYSFETGKNGMVALLGSNGSDTLLIYYLMEDQEQLYRYALNGDPLDPLEIKDFSMDEEGRGMMIGGNVFLHQIGNEIVVLNFQSNLVAWNLDTGIKRIVRKRVDRVLNVVEDVFYLSTFEELGNKVVAYEWKTGEEEVVLDAFQGRILAGGKTPEGLVLVDQDLNRLEYDGEGKLVSRESIIAHYDELNGGMKSYTALFFQGPKIYMTVMDFDNIERVSQSYFLSRKDGEAPNLKDQATLVVYVKNSDLLTDFIIKNYELEHKNIRIQLEVFDDLTDDEYLKKLNTDILGGKQIDLVFFDSLPVKKLGEKGFFEDLYGLLDKKVLSAADPDVVRAIEQDGKLIGLPLDLRILALYAEKTVATDAIYQAYMDSKKSIDDFETMTEALVEAGLAPFRKLTSAQILKGLVANNLHALVDDKGAFNADLYKHLVFLAEKLSKPPYVNEELDKDKYDFFGPKGTVALEPINQEGIMAVSGANARFEAKDYWILPYPSERDGYAFSASMLGIVKTSKNKAIAVEFLQAMALDEKVQKNKVTMQAVPFAFEYAKQAIEEISKEMRVGFIQGVETSYGDRILDTAEATVKDYEKLITYFQNSSRALVGGQKGMSLLMDGADRYFKGEVGMDELIGSLRNQFLLYANE